MTTVGAMQMPPDFRYRSVFLKGRPRHGEWDAFSLRHPAMDRGRRAKIFSPFDALKGFSEAVAAKDEIYVSRPEPGEEEREELNRRLCRLAERVRRGRRTGVGGARVRAVYFVPCGDREYPAWGLRGKLAAAEGLCTRLEAAAERSLTVDGTVIRLEDLLSLEGEGLSDPEWETDAP